MLCDWMGWYERLRYLGKLLCQKMRMAGDDDCARPSKRCIKRISNNLLGSVVGNK